MLKKNLIGAYRIRLYDLGERHGPFSCYGRIKANSTGKDIDVTNIYVKAGLPNCQTGLKLNSSFFNSQNNLYLSDAIDFDYVSRPINF